METINVAGDHLPPLVILPGVQIFESWVYNNLPGQTLLAVSKTGYTNDVIGLQWLKHFDRLSGKKQQGRYRLLLMDGHTSHLTYEFISYCESHNIIPFCLPPHSTDKLHPLDLVVFLPYKHWHAEAVDAATRTGCTAFNKVEFLAALNSIRNQAFKTSTIKFAWQVAGIYPWDPQAVIEQLPVLSPASNGGYLYHSSPPVPFPTVPTTPKTVEFLKRMATYLTDRSEPVSPTLQRFISGSLLQAYSGAKSQSDLMKQTAEVRARQERAKCRRILQSGGVPQQSAFRPNSLIMQLLLALLGFAWAKFMPTIGMLGMESGRRLSIMDPDILKNDISPLFILFTIVNDAGSAQSLILIRESCLCQ